MSILLVIIPDYISAILKKGEYQPNYYNPGELFDEVHLLLTNPDQPDLNALRWTVGRAALHVHNLPEPTALHRMAWDRDDFNVLEKWAAPAVELARRIKPNLIRCHSADLNAYLAFQIRKRLGIPYVVSLHINPDVNPTRRFLGDNLNEEQRSNNRLFDYIESVGLRHANLVMPVYEPIIPYLKRICVQHYQVCYNVLNGRDLRRKTDYAPHRPVRLLSVGRQFEDKNPENIIRALASLPEMSLTLVGDGSIHERLRTLAVECGVADRVQFMPAVINAELCWNLPDYDIFVIHTEYWELNKSLLEAMLAGLPVIMNRRRGQEVPELAGLDCIVQVENTPEAYRQALARVVEDDFLRADLGRRTGDHAHERYAPALTESKYVQVYQEYQDENPCRPEQIEARERLDFFACLNCGGRIAEPAPEAVTCATCGATYPVTSGVPLLVRDWKRHEVAMAQAQEVKPDWYLEVQKGEEASPWRHHLRKRRRYVERALKRHLRAKGLERVPRLLDLGCGDGNNLLWLRAFADRIYGSDYNPVRLRRAQLLVPEASLFLGDILDYPTADAQFDVVFFNHVIEHIPDDSAALATASRLLKPGGLLVLGTPNEGAWWWQLAYDRAPETRKTTDHVHFYTAPAICEKVLAQGLNIRHVEHLGWGPPDWDMDMKLRGYKVLDDIFEWVGRFFLRSQASSLYVLAEKPAV